MNKTVKEKRVRNKENSLEHVPKELLEHASAIGIKQRTIWARIYLLNWNYQKACTTPVKGINSKSYVRDGLEYAAYSYRLKYNPEFHENHRKNYTEDELIYIVSMWDSDMHKADIAMAVGKTHSAVMRKVYMLRKENKFDYYKSLAKSVL